jgi:hypothetical protein
MSTEVDKCGQHRNQGALVVSQGCRFDPAPCAESVAVVRTLQHDETIIRALYYGAGVHVIMITTANKLCGQVRR